MNPANPVEIIFVDSLLTNNAAKIIFRKCWRGQTNKKPTHRMEGREVHGFSGIAIGVWQAAGAVVKPLRPPESIVGKSRP
jgi:hypothetical protein